MENIALQESIENERGAISEYLMTILSPIASICTLSWHSAEQLDKLLYTYIPKLGNCKLLYTVSMSGIQCSANISSDGIDTQKRGQNLSIRPYMAQISKDKDFSLSPVYLDVNDHRPCITGLHRIANQQGDFIGYLAADYELSDLPIQSINSPTACVVPSQWRQIKGDPAIRQNLFQQERVTSPMDNQIQQVHDIIGDLIKNRGIFHAKLHYSSSRATLWMYNDPHRYQLHVLDEIINPAVCLAYRRQEYPPEAETDMNKIGQIFDQFVKLRDADNTIYLRSASLNVINNMVGLTFSCDGSHYMSSEEFLEKDLSFWFGQSSQT